ncbi:predicted protein [Lichtheimia corymbifera JMRC:FSU:9682]|uniref:Uncharacterized protein n=1 Tax=Lichtheimia corymbifera JMRC:FSU:9682 TaxID=1263082 RepID=A0A068RKW0_9FUNG|nr:predicted protein [Lichtheimia corymbifera JMRC:FSU:9682]
MPPSKQQSDDDPQEDGVLAIIKLIPAIIDIAKDIGPEVDIKRCCRKVKVTMRNGDQNATCSYLPPSKKRNQQKTTLFEVDFEDQVGTSIFTLEASIVK